MVADFINVGIHGRGVFIPFKQGLNSRLFQIPRKNEGRFVEVDTNYNAVVVLVIKVFMSPAWIVIAPPRQNRYLGIGNRAVYRVNRVICETVLIRETGDIGISD